MPPTHTHIFVLYIIYNIYRLTIVYNIYSWSLRAVLWSSYEARTSLQHNGRLIILLYSDQIIVYVDDADADVKTTSADRHKPTWPYTQKYNIYIYIYYDGMKDRRETKLHIYMILQLVLSYLYIIWKV